MNLFYFRSARGLFVSTIATWLLAVFPAIAGSFGVSPIRLDFDRTAKTGVITVTNDDESRLSFQMKLMVWTQDAQGVDRYAESSDLIFFPLIMTLEPKEKRIIRVGTRSPPSVNERTYRLFIEEIPDAGEAKLQGTAVAVKLRFGVPLFIAPAIVDKRGSIADAKFGKGEVQVTVKNSGNQHFRFETITLKAAGTTVGEVAGWYLLAGAERSYTIKLDNAACVKASKLEIALSADGLELKREIDVVPVLCHP